MAIKSIVVGTDGSETSYRAFAMVVGFAVREQGCVHACFVAHVPGAAALGGFLAPVPLVTYPESDDRLASFVTEELGQAHVGGDFTCRSGEVAAELELLAVSCKADLVVVGRSAHPRLHLGGVPRQLLAGSLPDPRSALSDRADRGPEGIGSSRPREVTSAPRAMRSDRGGAGTGEEHVAASRKRKRTCRGGIDAVRVERFETQRGKGPAVRVCEGYRRAGPEVPGAVCGLGDDAVAVHVVACDDSDAPRRPLIAPTVWAITCELTRAAPCCSVGQ